MANKRKLEQHIAVFGESGSGKTVLLSSFFGVTQEKEFEKTQPYRFQAADTAQGIALYKNYLEMRESAQLPVPTTTSSVYPFSAYIKSSNEPSKERGSIDEVRLVWHDYPGEWFEQSPQDEDELQRRVETFRNLLSADVAVLLVDGQRLRDNEGEESRYLKSLFKNMKSMLLSLKSEILPDGKRLAQFPRIWMVALSKADLWPELDAYQFRDLIIRNAGDDLADLKAVVSEFVKNPAALSIGKDFILLSSAKFEPGKIEVSDRVGIDLLLPLAAILPLKRRVTWAKNGVKFREGARTVLRGADAKKLVSVAMFIQSTPLLPSRFRSIAALAGRSQLEYVANALNLAGDKLAAANDDALAKHENLQATLLGFLRALEQGKEDSEILTADR